MSEKWAAPMGRLLSHDERPADCTGQASRDQTGRRRRNLEKAGGEVPVLVDGEGGEGRLRDGTIGRGRVGGDRGQK